MYQISFYVPKNEVENVKSAMFKAGAGKINNYTNCSWQTEGKGQFIPTIMAKPAIGELNQLKVMPEYKVEMCCEDGIIDKVVKMMKKSHPYEEVAYCVIKLENK